MGKGDCNKSIKLYKDMLFLLLPSLKKHHLYNNNKRNSCNNNYVFYNILSTTLCNNNNNDNNNNMIPKIIYNIASSIYKIGDFDISLKYYQLSLSMNLLLIQCYHQDQQLHTSTLSLSEKNDNYNDKKHHNNIVLNQYYNTLITLYDIANLQYNKGDIDTALDTLNMLMHYYNNTDCCNAAASNKNNAVIILLIKSISFMANIYLLNSNMEKTMELYCNALRLCKKYNIDENNNDILTSLCSKIHRFDIDHPLAAACA